VDIYASTKISMSFGMFATAAEQNVVQYTAWMCVPA